MTSQKDKLSEIAATTNAAARRFLSAVTNDLPLKGSLVIAHHRKNNSNSLLASGSATLR